MPKKILILYEKMGMGHLRMAQILKDMLEDENNIVEIHAGSDLLGTHDINIVVTLWNYFIKKNWIGVCDALINFFARIVAMPFGEAAQTRKLYKTLEEIKPDIVISTADAFNRALGTYTKEKNIPFYIFITEMSVFIDLVNPNATHIIYFEETGEAIRSYNFNWTYYSYKLGPDTKMGGRIKYVLKYLNEFMLHPRKNSIFRNPDRKLKAINDAKYFVVGPLAEKKHFEPKNTDEIRKKFNISSGEDCVTLASGSLGGTFLIKMMKILEKKYKNPLNVLIICGHDEDAYEKVIKLKDSYKNKSIKIIPFRYIDYFDDILAISDCLIARPSAGTFIESILSETPEITFSNVTSNDLGTLTMIRKYKIGEICSDTDEIVDSVAKILLNKDYYKNNIEHLLSKSVRTYEEKREIIRKEILGSTEICREIASGENYAD